MDPNHRGYEPTHFNSRTCDFGIHKLNQAIGSRLRLSVMCEAGDSDSRVEWFARIILLLAFALKPPEPEWARKLNELDNRFYANSDNLTSRLETFACEQGLVPPGS